MVVELEELAELTEGATESFGDSMTFQTLRGVTSSMLSGVVRRSSTRRGCVPSKSKTATGDLSEDNRRCSLQSRQLQQTQR